MPKGSPASQKPPLAAWQTDKAQEHDCVLHEAEADVDAYRLLAETAIADLQEPVEIYSAILQASFWLCATQAQARRLLEEGKVAYLPVEIRIFRMWRERWPERFPELLRRTHQAKKDLTMVLTTREEGQPVPQTCTICRHPEHAAIDTGRASRRNPELARQSAVSGGLTACPRH